MSIATQLQAISAQLTALQSGSNSNAPVLAAIADVAAQIGDDETIGTPGTGPLSSLTLNPPSVTGGFSSTATVSLSAISTTDSLVTLSSDNTSAVVPANVNIPAGSTSATFQVTTTSVSSPVTANLKASLSGVNQTAQLSITQ